MYLTVMSGRNLRKADFLGLGRSDPYCVVHWRGTNYKTAYVSGTSDPVWTERFELHQVGPNDDVQISVYDHDTIGRDDFLGSVTIPYRELTPGRKWHRLTSSRISAGEVQTDIEYR